MACSLLDWRGPSEHCYLPTGVHRRRLCGHALGCASFGARYTVAGKTWGLSGQLDGQIGRLHKPAAPYSVFFWHC